MLNLYPATKVYAPFRVTSILATIALDFLMLFITMIFVIALINKISYALVRGVKE